MTELERTIEAQRRCRDELFSVAVHPEAALIRLGISDWVAEEIIIRLEQLCRGKKSTK